MKTIAETLAWLERLGRPPLPECPIEAARQGKEPKAPCYFDGQKVISVKWSFFQNVQPSEEILKTWFAQPQTGIGTLGGWNGHHWIGWVDFDQKNFASEEQCKHAIGAWLETYSLQEAPCFKTPSGGYRFLIAFSREPENFKANSKFSLSPNGAHAGELLCKNGSHTLLPPTVGIGGQYEWIKFSEYPPIVDSPEDIGLYRAQNSSAQKQQNKRKKSDEPTAILPAAIVQPASRAARLWMLVRALDHPDNGGTGSGYVEVSVAELCKWLNRSERSVWRYIKEAKAKGYLYRCECEYGFLKIEYVGLRRLAKHLGLSGLGAIGEIPLSKLQHAKTYATDIQAEQLQGQSFHNMKEEFGRFAEGAKKAAELLAITSPSAGGSGGVVVARGHRLLYLAPHWRPFGASQEGIAKRLGVSVRTIQYRVNNGWRATRGLPKIKKRQSAHQVFEECPKEFLRDFMREEENATQKYVFLGRRLFRRGCNLYDTGTTLRSFRRRKSEYREAYYKDGEESSFLNASTPDTTLDYKVSNFSLNNFSELETPLQKS
jgi:DNA-binding Lrp family transcriptional regulator